MPIYEFRCLKCNECFEFLLMNQDDQIELRCPQCKSAEFERIVSATCHAIGGGPGKNTGAGSTSRTCSSGSCTTYDIPGPSR
jgi:putative FmdB family regulatory protein